MMISALYYTNILSWVFNNASSLKQQSAGRHVAPLKHINLILGQTSLCSHGRHVAPLKHINLILGQTSLYSYSLMLQA
jgi:hypothetical protein